MRILVILFLLIGLLCACCSQADPGTRPITNANTILAMSTDDWGLFSPGKRQLIVAVWDDGTIIWSKNRLEGGTPYFTGKVDPVKVTDLLTQMEKQGIFTDKNLQRSHWGPDSKFSEILIKYRKKTLNIRSWHELYEAGGKTVATSSGLEPLNGRKIETVLQNEPKEYQDFRSMWSKLRQQITGLIPQKETPAHGKVQMKAGIMSWQQPHAPDHPESTQGSRKQRK